MQALERGEMTVLGGDQIRPNIHIDDITDLYLFLLDNKNLNGPINAGFENLSIMQIAELISSKVDAKIVIKQSNDPRSYRLDSTKLLDSGFRPKKTVENAIDEIIQMYRIGGLKNDTRWHNLKWMTEQGLVNEKF
jgi:nucleoside-diphosphate-sugar epimerase